MATRVRAISDLRCSTSYRPGDFVITHDSMFLDLEPALWHENTGDIHIQVYDYMNLHPYLFEQKYGCAKPDEQIINWVNKVYLLLDYNKRSGKWRAFRCPEFTSGPPQEIDINSWIHLPEENILTQVEPLIVNHPVARWWLLEDVSKNNNNSVNEYSIKLKKSESWDNRHGVWKTPSMKNGRSGKEHLFGMFHDESIVGEEEVELIPVGSIFCVNAEKVLKQYAPGFLIKVKSDDYFYSSSGNKTFNNEKYEAAETYQEDGFEYYYTDIRSFNLKFKLVDNTDPYCIFLQDLEFQ